jgi:hypothetical protein
MLRKIPYSYQNLRNIANKRVILPVDWMPLTLHPTLLGARSLVFGQSSYQREA